MLFEKSYHSPVLAAASRDGWVQVGSIEQFMWTFVISVQREIFLSLDSETFDPGCKCICCCPSVHLAVACPTNFSRSHLYQLPLAFQPSLFALCAQSEDAL